MAVADSGGEHVVVIEVEWTEGRLTGVSSTRRRYEINRTTGAATQLNPSAPIVTPSGTAFGAADDGSFLLVVSENGSVLDINKIGGMQTGLPAATPAGRIVALAWRHPGQPQRMGIDSATDALYDVQLQSGVMALVSIGPLGAETSATAQVTVTFLRENDTPVIKTFAVPPASRLTIDVGSAHVPEITDGSFGADIVSSVPIAVERAMYSNANGQFWAAGTNAAATRLP